MSFNVCQIVDVLLGMFITFGLMVFTLSVFVLGCLMIWFYWFNGFWLLLYFGFNLVLCAYWIYLFHLFCLVVVGCLGFCLDWWFALVGCCYLGLWKFDVLFIHVTFVLSLGKPVVVTYGCGYVVDCCLFYVYGLLFLFWFVLCDCLLFSLGFVMCLLICLLCCLCCLRCGLFCWLSFLGF